MLKDRARAMLVDKVLNNVLDQARKKPNQPYIYLEPHVATEIMHLAETEFQDLSKEDLWALLISLLNLHFDYCVKKGTLPIV